MKRPPRRIFRSRGRPADPPAEPAIRVVGMARIAGEDVPLLEPIGMDDLDQMALDRAIAARTGLPAWARPIRPDDPPEPARALDPTPEQLADAEVCRRQMAAASHVLVRTLAPGVRSRIALDLYDESELN